MYIVIHSQDPYLLARMATDLQMEGINGTYEWNRYTHPLIRESSIFLHIIMERNTFEFYNHDGQTYDHLINITEENYLTTLSFILKNKDK